MTTDQLRRELSRLAETAPAPQVARDTWTRARRSLVRDRIAGTAAAVALVAGGALVAMPVLHHTQEAEPTLPSHYSASGDSALPVEDDLAVGPVALAYPLEIDGSMRAVVSTAGEGTHHALALPDLVSADARLVWVGGQPLRLSPDGTELAYLTDSGGGDGGATGIDIVDLRTGAVRRSELPQSLATPKLAWSPSGTWLAWSGLPVNADGRSTGRAQVSGLIGPDGAGSQLKVGYAELAPADDGTVAVLPPGKPIRIWEDGRLGSSIDDGPAGHAETARLADGVLSELRVVADPESDLGSRTLLMRHGDRAESAEVPAAVALAAQVFGWTADGAVLLTSRTSETGQHTVYRLELGDGKVSYRKVLALDPSLPSVVTIATALPSADDGGGAQSVWPWLLGGGALLAMALLILVVRLRSARQERRVLRPV